MKHRLKLWAREVCARVLFHTGLHALVSRLSPPRLTILFGHCVADGEANGHLPADMRIDERRLEGILRWLARRHRPCTIGEGLAQLRREGGAARGRSLVALSMDDGYRDNRTRLLPLLQRTGFRATVFLETRPLDERRLSWSHQLFWLLFRGVGAEELARRYVELSEHEPTRERLRALLAEGRASLYHVKRVLKYEAEEGDRDRVIGRLFAVAGGDESAVCDALYMSWDDARALRDGGVELGGHTVRHEILSRLDPERQRAEIEGSAASLEHALGSRPRVFAYPFGRRWDYDAASVAAARAAGFEAAVCTHAGTNGPASDRFQLRRLPIDDGARLHLIAAEACGGFELLRRFGIDLSE